MIASSVFVSESSICIATGVCLQFLLPRELLPYGRDDTLLLTTQSRSLLIPLNLRLYISLRSSLGMVQTHQIRFYFPFSRLFSLVSSYPLSKPSPT